LEELDVSGVVERMKSAVMSLHTRTGVDAFAISASAKPAGPENPSARRDFKSAAVFVIESSITLTSFSNENFTQFTLLPCINDLMQGRTRPFNSKDTTDGCREISDEMRPPAERGLEQASSTSEFEKSVDADEYVDERRSLYDAESGFTSVSRKTLIRSRARWPPILPNLRQTLNIEPSAAAIFSSVIDSPRIDMASRSKRGR
jgi:hypothetical protein